MHRQHRGQCRFADRDVLVEAENAREGNVEEGEDPVGRLDHHIVAEAVIVAGTGAARIHQRGAGRAPGDEAGIDAERGRLVVDVGVDVDEARGHDGAGDVAHLAGAGIDARGDRGNAARFDRHIHGAIDAVARIDDAAAPEDEIVFRLHLLPPGCATPRGGPFRSVAGASAALWVQASSTTRFSLMLCSAASTMRRLLTAASMESDRSMSSLIALRKKSCSRSQRSW